MIYVVEAAPISIGGIGIREGAFVFFFTQVGLSIEQAFALSIIVLFGRLCCAVTGGVLYLATRHRVPRPDDAGIPLTAKHPLAAHEPVKTPVAVEAGS
jgi:glycosyltransferase 2 family protein